MPPPRPRCAGGAGSAAAATGKGPRGRWRRGRSRRGPRRLPRQEPIPASSLLLASLLLLANRVAHEGEQAPVRRGQQPRRAASTLRELDLNTWSRMPSSRAAIAPTDAPLVMGSIASRPDTRGGRCVPPAQGRMPKAPQAGRAWPWGCDAPVAQRRLEAAAGVAVQRRRRATTTPPAPVHLAQGRAGRDGRVGD